MLSKNVHIILLFAAGLAFAACGSGSESGEPLLSGNVTGTYGDDTFTAVNGFAYSDSDTAHVIGLGDGPLNCSSPNKPDPPSGMMAGINLSSLEVGTYNSVLITIYRNVGGFEGKGTNSGNVEITASSAESVAGTVAYNDESDGTTLALNGTFEVVYCP